MKKIVLALTFVLVGSFMLAGCSKDEILNHYNNIVQSAGAIELTGKLSLKGTKEKGSEGCSSRTSVLKEIIYSLIMLKKLGNTPFPGFFYTQNSAWTVRF